MGLINSRYPPKYDRFVVAHGNELKNVPDHDLLSPCQFYLVLNRQCRSFASEATSIWSTGEPGNCRQWKEAYENCQKWEQSKDRDALEKVLLLERKLFSMRQIDMFLNNVWELRDSAKDGEPPHFNAPLPLELQKLDDD